LGLAKKGISQLVKSLKVNTTLKKLGLRGNAINNYGATIIARALISHNTTLTSLDLTENPMLNEWFRPDHSVKTEAEPEGLPTIACSLERNRSNQKQDDQMADVPRISNQILQERYTGVWQPDRTWLAEEVSIFTNLGMKELFQSPLTMSRLSVDLSHCNRMWMM